MTTLLKWRGFCLIHLFILLAACSTNTSTDVSKEKEIELTCTRSWPLVQKSSGFSTNAKAVQYLLRAHRYSLAVDGYFGPGTEAVVKSFQRSKGLSADGKVGKNTFEQLVITVSQGSKGDAVRAAQTLLGNLKVDSDFGPATNTFVKNFQASKGLGVDGKVGKNTWAALFGGKGCGSTTPPPPPPPVNPPDIAKLHKLCVNKKNAYRLNFFLGDYDCGELARAYLDAEGDAEQFVKNIAVLKFKERRVEAKAEHMMELLVVFTAAYAHAGKVMMDHFATLGCAWVGGKTGIAGGILCNALYTKLTDDVDMLELTKITACSPAGLKTANACKVLTDALEDRLN